MRRASIALAVLVVVGLGTSPVLADTQFSGTIQLYDGPGGNNGGVFHVDVLTDLTAAIQSNPFAWSPIKDFPTFCIEKDEYFNWNTAYDVTLSTVAWKGGVNTNAGDELSADTNALYLEFRLNSGAAWSGYGYDNSITSQTALQEAIWFLEEEITSVSAGLATNLVNWAGDNSVALTTGVQSGGNTYTTAVMVLSKNGNVAQDQLAMVTVGDYQTLVPTPSAALAGALMLFSLGVVGLRRRKIRKG